MKFRIINKEFENALTSLMVKGKHLSSSGFSTGNLGTEVYVKLTGHELMCYNGDGTFMARLKLDNPIVEGIEDGLVSLNTETMLPYLATFNNTEYTDVVVDNGCITMSQDSKKAVCPVLTAHRDLESINRMITMLSHINHESTLESLFNFSNSKFEGGFILNNDVFKEAIKNCELVKTGIYRLDFDGTTVSFSSATTNQNSFSDTLTPTGTLGEEATVLFSSPLYSFFNKGQSLNFYVKDEFPLLIVAEDRLLLKAPHIGG